jgi:hypothetical protein
MIMSKPNSKIDSFLNLSKPEKDAAFREFDREFVGDTFGPLKPAQQKAWRKAKQRMALTKSAARRISLTVPRELLSKSDAFAKKAGLSRSELVRRGLKAILAGKT